MKSPTKAKIEQARKVELPVEVRRDIEAKKLPRDAEPILLGLMAELREYEMKDFIRVDGTVVGRLDRSTTSRSVLPKQDRLKVDLQTAKKDLSSLKTLLDRMRSTLGDRPMTREPAIKVEEALMALRELKVSVFALKRSLVWMMDMSKPKRGRRGAPSIPEHLYWYGTQAVATLARQGIVRAKAARAVVACLRPFLPKRHGAEPEYKFGPKLLLRRMPRKP